MRERVIPRLPQLRGRFLPVPTVCGEYTVQIDEGDRQMICLALAELAQSRPGWAWTLRRCASLLPNGGPMYDGFAALHGSSP